MSTDQLHKPLAEYGVPPQRILIRYQVDPERQKVTKRVLTEEEQTQLRGSVVGFNFAARQGRPDAAAAASVIASAFPNPTVSDAKMANNTIARLKANDVTIKIWSLPEEDLRRILIMDSAFDTPGQSRSQHGWIVGYTTPALAAGRKRQFLRCSGSRANCAERHHHHCYVRRYQAVRRWPVS